MGGFIDDFLAFYVADNGYLLVTVTITVVCHHITVTRIATECIVAGIYLMKGLGKRLQFAWKRWVLSILLLHL